MKIKNLRWWIVGILALGTANSYIDRQSFPIVLDEIRNTVDISQSQFGMLGSLFLIAYALMYAGGGKLLDTVGTRSGYAILVIWWTIATGAQGLLSGVVGFGIARFALGLGEGGTFPASAKAVSEWFPAKERSMAFGIFNTGSSIGAIIAPPIIAAIIMAFSWRWVFFYGALLGLIWLIFWYFFYDNGPANSRYVTKNEKKYIESGQEKTLKPSERVEKVKWIDLFKFRSLNALMIAKFLTDSAWYFFIFWLPTFLVTERGLDIRGVGLNAWIPWVFAACGSFFAGLTSSYLIKKGFTLNKSRKLTLGISAALLPFSLLIVESPLAWTIVFFSIAYMGHQAFSTLIQTMAADLFPPRMVGSVAGLIGFAGALGGAIFNSIGGFLVESTGYTLVFIILGVLHPLSYLIILFMIKNIQIVVKS